MNTDIEHINKRIKGVIDEMHRDCFKLNCNISREESIDDFNRNAEEFYALISHPEVCAKENLDFTYQDLAFLKNKYFDEFSIYITDKSYGILKKIFNIGKSELKLLGYKVIQSGRLEILKWLERDFPLLFKDYLNEYISGALSAPEGSLHNRNFIEFAITYNLDIKKMIPFINSPSEKFSYLSPQNVLNIEGKIREIPPNKLRDIFVLCSSEARATFIERALEHHGKIPEVKALFNCVHFFDYHMSKTSGLAAHRASAISILMDNFDYTREDLDYALKTLNEGIQYISESNVDYIRNGISNLIRSFIRVGYIDEVSRIINTSENEQLEAIKNEELMKMTMDSPNPSTRKRLPI